MDLSSTSVVCREIFDENSQPSAEEISEYAQQIGIDPESEGHLLPLAKDGLMQALPPPWIVYYDEKASAHYYYNEELKVTQWEHPLDNIYRDLVKKARDVSIHDDTCASVQELPTFEENPKQAETKNDSDDECLLTDSDVHSDTKDKRGSKPASSRTLAPLGRPPRAPIPRAIDKRLNELRISPLRRSIDGFFIPGHNEATADGHHPKLPEKPKLIKQQSEIIDLKMPVQNSPEENPFNAIARCFKDQGQTLIGKGDMFKKCKKANLLSRDSQNSFTQDSGTKIDTPKGILRETLVDIKPTDAAVKSTASFEDDKKSVRFQLEKSQREATMSPSSNSSSDKNDGASSIISAPPPPSTLVSALLNQTPPRSPSVPSLPAYIHSVPNYPKKLAPLTTRPAMLQMDQTNMSAQAASDAPKDDLAENNDQLSPSPKRRLLRPPAADYIKPDLFMKSFQKISDMVKPVDDDGSSASVEQLNPLEKDKEKRPRSPMVPPQKSKISINLMESIDSDSSLDEPDREMENLHLEEAMEELNKPTSEDDNGADGAICFSPWHEPGKSSAQSLEESIKHTNEMLSSRSSSVEHPLVTPVPKKGIPINLKIDHATKLDLATKSGGPSQKPAVAKPPHLNINCTAPNSKSLGSPKIDGVIISQGNGFNKDPDDVVVMLQFEHPPQEVRPLNDAEKEAIEKIRAEERSRLEALLESELEKVRSDWAVKERSMRDELQDKIANLEESFEEESRRTLIEVSEIHHKQLGEAKRRHEQNFADRVYAIIQQNDEKFRRKSESLEKEYEERVARVKKEHEKKLTDEKNAIIRTKLENERTLREMRDKSIAELEKEKARFIEERESFLSKLKEEHIAKVKDLKEDYRAEVDRLRNQHACHLEEIRGRLASERAAAAKRGQSDHQALADKYKCLKEKYARLKRDVRLSLERRNKRREMSLTTGSETEKSNSNKGNQSLEKCKESNEEAVSAPKKAELFRARPTKNATKNDNETSLSESQANKSYENNNIAWKEKQNEASMVLSPETSQASAAKPPTLKANRRPTVAFREPQKKRRDRKERDAGTSDCQDSSDATTTADEKPKTPVNGRGRRRCFTRLKSASTSRLNYSPKRGEGWSSPLEALRQQLKKLDDLEDQFPDIAGQSSYSMRYPFAELGEIGAAGTPEVEFVRHRAVIERESMRRARATLRRRRAVLAASRASTEPYAQPSDDKDTTELEVALHRARALLGEKEIRLRHIERSLHRMADTNLAKSKQDDGGSEDSSESSPEGGGVASGVMLQSLRALHADVRDIWLALDARPTRASSAETRSRNAVSPQHRISLSAAEPLMGTEDAGVKERAKDLRAWLETSP